MNKGFMAIFIFTCFYIRGSAQNYIPYYNLVNEGEYALYNGDFEKAATKYSAAFKLEKPHARDSYLLAYCLSKLDSLKNRKEIEKILIKASAISGSIPHYLDQQPLSLELDSSFLAKLNSKSEKWNNETRYLRDTITYFSFAYNQMLELYVDSLELWAVEEKVSSNFMQNIRDADYKYQAEFYDYILKNGYPDIYASGDDMSYSILFRMPESLYLDFEKLLYEELRKGNLTPEKYGGVVDRMGCRMNEKSFYGTTDLLNPCQPAKDEIIINRINIGLSQYFKSPRRSVRLASFRELEF